LIAPAETTREGLMQTLKGMKAVVGADDAPDGQWRPLKLIVICKQPDVFCIALATAPGWTEMTFRRFPNAKDYHVHQPALPHLTIRTRAFRQKLARSKPADLGNLLNNSANEEKE
jgi:hypothetical protein